MLKAERHEGRKGFKKRAQGYFKPEDPPAVRAAKTWIQINSMCADVSKHLDDPEHVQFVRIEDLNGETAAEMLEKLGLEDIDRDRLGEVFGAELTDLRHSHVGRSDLKTPVASEEELDTIRELTRETAARFGYEV